MQTEYTLQATEIRGISLQFDTFQTLNRDKGEREICHGPLKQQTGSNRFRFWNGKALHQFRKTLSKHATPIQLLFANHQDTSINLLPVLNAGLEGSRFDVFFILLLELVDVI